MSDDVLTIHQLLNSEGLPLVKGTQVRMPDGTSIPGVLRVDTYAEAGGGLWRTTITVHARFGAPMFEDRNNAAP